MARAQGGLCAIFLLGRGKLSRALLGLAGSETRPHTGFARREWAPTVFPSHD